ncbi:MAG: dihydrofolate reductase, partial [Capnocytophaga sp.]|nr:dihydrofolate reductase [Capnocytophaga sp.]
FFPPIPPTHFTLVSKEHVAADEKHLYSFTFERYIKIDN